MFSGFVEELSAELPRRSPELVKINDEPRVDVVLSSHFGDLGPRLDHVIVVVWK